jgi:hypothetical protein
MHQFGRKSGDRATRERRSGRAYASFTFQKIGALSLRTSRTFFSGYGQIRNTRISFLDLRDGLARNLAGPVNLFGDYPD